MEAVKIVSQLEDKTDSIEMFGGFHHAIIQRGVWKTDKERGFGAFVAGILHPLDVIIFNTGKQPPDGSKCKLVMLQMPDSFIKIGTDARAYILGKNGKTIEAIY